MSINKNNVINSLKTENEREKPLLIDIKSREREIVIGGALFMQMFKIPKDFGAAELVKEIKRQTGTDYSAMLEAAKIAAS